MYDKHLGLLPPMAAMTPDLQSPRLNRRRRVRHREERDLRVRRHAVLAGRQAYLAGRMPKKLYATASSPLEGVVR